MSNNSSLSRLAAINVNSIVANCRRLELIQFLQDYDHDFIFLSETKLNGRHKISFKDYNLGRRDRPNSIQGGGTAILVRKGLAFEEVFLPSVDKYEILECSIIKLYTHNNKILFLISVYAKNDNRRLFIDELDNLFYSLKLYDNNI